MSRSDSGASSGGRGRTLVLAAIAVALSLSLAWTVVTVVAAGSLWLAERIPWTLLLVILCWALYAGYAPVRWLWVATSLLLSVALGVDLATAGDLPVWLGLPMAFGYAFVGLTLALAPSVREFLEDRKRRRDVERGGFDPAYTAMLAFIGCSHLWALGGLWSRGLLGRAPEEPGVLVIAVGITTGGAVGLALLNLVVAGYRSARRPFARRLTTVASFLLPVQFPLGTAAFGYWLVKVRPSEGAPPASDGSG